jgi:hypothetical protein
MLQPFDHGSAEKSKHKFMVQTMLAPAKFKLENLDSVVSDMGWRGIRPCLFSEIQGNSGHGSLPTELAKALY